MERRSNQGELPFAAAEGSFQERRGMLGAAICRAECDLYVARLLFLVFEATDGGRGEVQFTHDELKRRPDRLCCETSTVRAALGRAQATGILRVRPTATPDGFRRANSYAIDGAAVDRWRQRPPPSVASQQASVASQQASVASQQASVARLRGEGGDSVLESLDSRSASTSMKIEAIPPPPSLPNTARPVARQQASVARQQAEWLPAKLVLAQAGVKATDAAVAEAARRGMPVEQLVALAEYLAANHEKWGPGAIFFAIREWRRETAADDPRLWPTPAAVCDKWGI